MTKSKVKPLTTEDISEALRHFRKIVLEGKHPNNNFQMIDMVSIIAETFKKAASKVKKCNQQSRLRKSRFT